LTPEKYSSFYSKLVPTDNVVKTFLRFVRNVSAKNAFV
jgi:hypothetical protein